MSQVPQIKRLLAASWSQTSIARYVGCSRSYVSHVAAGRHDKRRGALVEAPATLSPERVSGECMRCGFRGHSTKRCPVRYRLVLTRDEINALYFIGDRYSWTRVLVECHEGEEVLLTEAEMWEWQHDVEDDMVGGHSPFPMASPALAEKLRLFLEECV